MVHNAFLSVLFSGVLSGLLSAIVYWFEHEIVESQNKYVDNFQRVTRTSDIGTPMKSITRQLSFASEVETEKKRDEMQMEILQQMIIDLRTKKSNYIDEEATRAFQFACDIRQQLERGIGYRVVNGNDLKELLRTKGFYKLNCNSNGFLIFCHPEAVQDFKVGRSHFLESTLNSLQYVNDCKQIRPEDLFTSNNNEMDISQSFAENEADSFNTSGNLR